MTGKPPYESFYRVWLAFGQTPSHHERFHASLWRPNIDEGRVVRILTDAVSKSPAADPDREAVLHYIVEDWRNARVMASMASSCTVSADAGFHLKLLELITATGLTVNAFCEKHKLSQSSVQSYVAGTARPTWDKVQELAKALGVSTDVFRDK